MCEVAGSSPWLGGLPCAELGLCGSLFRFYRVGRGWPTPIHAPGEWEQHDFSDLPMGFARQAVLGVHTRVSRRALSCHRGCGQCPHSRLRIGGPADLSTMSGRATNLSITVPGM